MRDLRMNLRQNTTYYYTHIIVTFTNEHGSDISCRLWAGCMDGAKMTRRNYVRNGKEIELTPPDRRIADEKVQQCSNDAIYKPLFFELIENNHFNRHCEWILLNSSIKRYLRRFQE